MGRTTDPDADICLEVTNRIRSLPPTPSHLNFPPPQLSILQLFGGLLSEMTQTSILEGS